MPQTYEIEIKTLLGSKERALELKRKLTERYPDTALISSGKQLNHYFNLPEDLTPLYKTITPLLSEDKVELFDKILENGKKISIRTRDADGTVIFVVKASLDDQTSSNGVSRIEFEAVMPELTLAELDQILLDAGLTYQAKWSREREEFANGEMKVCFDKNAGYGYLAEFERVLNSKDEIESAKRELLDCMAELGVEELAQDRLERMFNHYNNNWREYYGTDLIFVIE